jgi:purine-binding chemotaxis protein CheW
MQNRARRRLLVAEAAELSAGIPLESVREIMRPLPIAALADAPDFVLGLATIRGAATPVVDLGRVLGGAGASKATFGRFISLHVDGRSVALAVQAVSGVLELEETTELPPLLSEAAMDAVESLSLRDAGLLLVLRSARLVPDTGACAAEGST